RPVALVEDQPVEGNAVAIEPDQLVQGDPPLGPIADVVGDAGGLTAFAVGIPCLGQVQLGVQQGLEAAFGHADMDGDDAVVDLTHTAQVLPLYSGRLVAPLAATGLVDNAHGAQRVRGQLGDGVGQLPLQEVAHVLVVPACGSQKFLEGPHGSSGFEGDGFDGFAGQVGEQAPAVVVKVGGRALLEKAAPVASQVSGVGRPQAGDFLFGHRIPSPITTELSAIRESALYC